MEENIDILEGFRAVWRFYERSERGLCLRSGVSQTELDILAFLHNHPEQNTAWEIVELRMLQKTNVSPAVESLIGKGLLYRAPDECDRRKIRLFLTERGEALYPEIRAVRHEMLRRMFAGFSQEELDTLYAMCRRVFGNAAAGLKPEAEHGKQ